MPELSGYRPKSTEPIDPDQPPEDSALLPPDGETANQTAAPSEIPDLIERFAELREKGLLNNDEFESAKADLLKQLA